ncbi:MULTISPECIES: hypothetical protein [Bacillus cereus group]|uniref:Uncharacterized protein n=1 Tax=Bacillus paramycoides TaxID=2026194 RepID=A0ABU6MRK6_9BACI|nr:MULTISPECIES: hypothetical protein [Bacillus cereus group]MED1565341.1 hypothetical protein [Bacillus paramycoides]MED1625963.1 hypothetical protein [Bacillus mycoides]
MDKTHLENIIQTLIDDMKQETQEGHFWFWRYMEQICDKENEELYILADLPLLAQVLREKNAETFTQILSLFDSQKTCKLKQLLA